MSGSLNVDLKFSGQVEGDIGQVRNGKFTRIPRQSAVPDVDRSDLPADGTISGLTISDPPTQSEVQALRDECENLRDALKEAMDTIDALKARLKVTGGNGLIAD